MPKSETDGLEAWLSIATKRVFSNKFDLGEAISDTINQLPERGVNTVDFLGSLKVINIGAQIVGIAGFNRLFVDVQGLNYFCYTKVEKRISFRKPMRKDITDEMILIFVGQL
jgi:hypothetical protein